MELKYMTFLIKVDALLEKYNKVWNTVSSSMKKVFDSEPWYNESYLKNEIKSYKGKPNAMFHSDKVPKEGSQCICLSVILIDSVFRNVKKYYPYMFLEERNYILEEEKIPNILLITFERATLRNI